jgi:hypothetical protein
MDLSTCIGFIHLCGMVIQNLYGFIFIKNETLDKLYMISFVTIPFSWIICKDECIISYISKKIENPSYKLGDEPENITDINMFFKNKSQYLVFYNINNVIRICSVIIVNERTTHINNYICIPTFILYLFYNYTITYKLHYAKNLYPYFHIIISIYLFTIFYKTIHV